MAKEIKQKVHVLHARRMEIVMPGARQTRGTPFGRVASKGGLTIAWEDAGAFLRIGIARCNLTDLYQRKIGCRLAKEKLELRSILLAKVDTDPYRCLHDYIGRSPSLRRSMRTTLVRPTIRSNRPKKAAA